MKLFKFIVKQIILRRNKALLLLFCYIIAIVGSTLISSGDYSIEDVKDNRHLIVETPFETVNKKFKPDWKDLDTRKIPEWYDKAKIGIFLHWGLYCVPGFHSEWFWTYWRGSKNKDIVEFMAENYPPDFTYQDFAPLFKAEFFDPNKFAELFSKAGAKYVVLTSKHHEGFTLFPSHRSFSWNSVDTGPHRDLVGEISEAVRQKNLKFGVYHSLYEWYNPMYIDDKQSKFTKRDYVDTKVWPDIKQLVNNYKPSIIWSDGDWEAKDTYWKSTELLAWLYNDSPVKDEILVNDRWGRGIHCHHGDFYNCADRFNPGSLQNHKWENAFTLDVTSWGYRRNMAIDEVMTIDKLLKEVISTVSCGGNALINIGPTKEGTIAPIFEQRLLELGKWLEINGEGIYESSPWVSQNDTYNNDVWYTCKKAEYNAVQPTASPDETETVLAIYAFFLAWPYNKENTLNIADTTQLLQHGDWKVVLLGNEDRQLKWVASADTGKTKIYLPHLEHVNSTHAWTLKFTQQ